MWRPAGDDAYVQEMRDIVKAWEAREDGVGVLLVNGRLVEELHVKEVGLCLSVAATLSFVAALSLEEDT